MPTKLIVFYGYLLPLIVKTTPLEYVASVNLIMLVKVKMSGNLNVPEYKFSSNTNASVSGIHSVVSIPIISAVYALNDPDLVALIDNSKKDLVTRSSMIGFFNVIVYKFPSWDPSNNSSSTKIGNYFKTL